MVTDHKVSPSGTIALSTVVSQICGIIMQSSHHDAEIKTLTLETVKKEGTNHRTSNGSIVPYSSIIRFLNMIDSFEPNIVDARMKKRNVPKLESIEAKQVTFNSQKQISAKESHLPNKKRPSTPENCYWED